MSINVNVNVSVPFLEKLLEYAASGIGSVAGSIMAPWNASREVKANKILALGENQVREIRAEGKVQALQIITDAQAEAQRAYELPAGVQPSEPSIAEAVEQRILYQEQKRQRNIQDVLGKAADAATSTEVPDQEPDHDWTARFFNSIQDVSSEEMQKLWAKILAGEVERPGSTSTRTLSILRDLDQSTASLFKAVWSMAAAVIKPDGTILDSRVISLGGNAADNALKEHGLQYDRLNILNEHGLIVPEFNSWMDYKPFVAREEPSDPAGWLATGWFIYQGRRWGLVPSGESKQDEEFRVYGVALTVAGRELSRVIDLVSVPAYDDALVSFFSDNGFTMTLVRDS